MVLSENAQGNATAPVSKVSWLVIRQHDLLYV